MKLADGMHVAVSFLLLLITHPQIAYMYNGASESYQLHATTLHLGCQPVGNYAYIML